MANTRGRTLWTPAMQNNLRKTSHGKPGSYMREPLPDDIVDKIDEMGTDWTSEFQDRQAASLETQAVRAGMPVEFTDALGNPIGTTEKASPEAQAVAEDVLQGGHPSMEHPTLDMPTPGTEEFYKDRVQDPERFIDLFSMDSPPDDELDSMSPPERRAMLSEAIGGARVQRFDSETGEPITAQKSLQDVEDDDARLADLVNQAQGVGEVRDPAWVGQARTGSK